MTGYTVVMAKHTWAHEHLKVLHQLEGDYLKSGPYETAIEEDTAGVELRFRITRVNPVPREVSLIAGDIIHNTRSVLDHLAFALATSPTTKTKFPLLTKPPANGSAYIPGCANPTINRIVDSVQDYRASVSTADPLLTLLNAMDILDKHKLLLTAVTSYDGARHGIEGVAQGDAELTYEWGKLEVGKVVATVRFGSPRPGYRPTFRLTPRIVLLDDGGVEYPAQNLLWRMLQHVDTIVNQFRSYV